VGTKEPRQKYFMTTTKKVTVVPYKMERTFAAGWGHGEDRQTRVATHAVERQVRAAAAGNEQADRSAIAALPMIT